MFSNLNINNFVNWAFSDKLSLFDQKDFSAFYNLAENDSHKLLQCIVGSSSENIYIRKQALQLYIDFMLCGHLKQTRKVITFLLDYISSEEEHFVLMCKLKNLWLFYEKEKEEIEEFYLSFTHSDNELMAEKFMGLGYINTYKSASATDKSNFDSCLSNMRMNFIAARELLENRTDAEYFLAFCDIWLSIHSDSPAINTIAINNIIDEFGRNSLNPQDYIFQTTMCQVLQSTNEFVNTETATWIDYQSEFKKLYVNWYNIHNAHIQNKIKDKGIIKALIKHLDNAIMEPYFERCYLVEKLKIEKCIIEVGKDSDLGQFLTHILSLPFDGDINISNIRNLLKELSLCPISDKELMQIKTIEDAKKLLFNDIDRIKGDKFEYINAHIEHALIELQKNTMFSNATEDQRNTFIRSILSNSINITDQTFSGVSSSGHSAGEVDLLIRDFNNMPYSYIEAMNLTSVSKKYVSEHIKKIFGYDSAGCENNYIICYVQLVDFESFWRKYIEFVKTEEVGFVRLNDEEVATSYCNFKRHKISYLRNGKEVTMHHIAVLIHDNH